MFEDQYRKAFDKATPSEALQQETLELMQEARAHHIPKEAPPAPRRLRYIPAVATAAAALLVGCVLLGFWLRQGNQMMEDGVGEMDAVFGESTNDSELWTGEDAFDSFVSEEQMPSGDGTKEDPSQSANNDGSNTNNSESDDAFSDESWSPDSEHSMTAPPADSSEEEKSPSEDKVVPSAKEEYASLSDFSDALSKKTAAGYGKNYYNTRELLIVPSLLPDHAAFQYLQLNGEDGTYSYSYFFTANEGTYRLTVEVQTAAPQTLPALTNKLNGLSEETVGLSKEGNTRTYLFGEDRAEVRVAPLSGNLLPDEATMDLLLQQFQLERCSKNNELLGLSS